MTSRLVAWWVCRDQPDVHPPYRMSRLAREKHAIGCAICRRMARTRGRRSA